MRITYVKKLSKFDRAYMVVLGQRQKMPGIQSAK